MSNHLIHENSPYLLKHAHNPVDWYPWGQEALERARTEDKPIFLSIGYAACHWCHVMEHESFEDPATAELMNEHFINIKVDREERPDLDSIYMTAVTAMTGQGGWPMSVFLTPDLQPFYGGTYFPPQRRYQMPSFSEILLGVALAWQQKRAEVLSSSAGLAEHLRSAVELAAAGLSSESGFSVSDLEQASLALVRDYDWSSGGWGRAPKFPQPMTIDFLLSRALRGDHSGRDAALHALEAMARGGMYDVVGGGFARYSTDEQWLIPHFEKMLYDNAQLALAYLHGWLVSGRADFRRVCEETLDFVLRELTDSAGGFYSSLDADSEGREGIFYLWTPAEIRAALEDDALSEFCLAAYGVTEQGNFEGRTILQRALPGQALGERFGLTPEQVQSRLDEVHRRLLQARAARIRPATDDKVLVAWNGLMLSAFAEAARYLSRADYLDAARRSAGFLLAELNLSDGLRRSWRQGQARHAAYLEDYAALGLGLLALYQSDPNLRWFQAANQLAEEMVTGFSDPSGGFFDTHQDAPALLLRPKDIQDNATPSGNALAAQLLLELAAYRGRGDWRQQAENVLKQVQAAAGRYPTAFARWLSAADFALGPVAEVALLGDPQAAEMQALRQGLWSVYRPNLIAAEASYPPPAGSPELLFDRPLLDGKPAAYVCLGFVCRQPVGDAVALQQVLSTLLEVM